MNPRELHTCDHCEEDRPAVHVVRLCPDCKGQLAGLYAAYAEAERLEGERDRLAEACRAFLAQLDYLQNLWSKEGVTNTIAEKARAALAGLEDDA